VVVHGEALRLRLGQLRQALRTGRIEVTPRLVADVAGDARLAPSEVVGRGDVGKEVEALGVAEVQAGLDEARRIDDERRLAVRLSGLDEAGDSLVGQEATPRIS
jgi:hypothetical protein